MSKYSLSIRTPLQPRQLTNIKDASGWTPLMIASSLREEDGLVDLLLSKEADVNVKNYSGQVPFPYFPLPFSRKQLPSHTQKSQITSI